MRGFSLDRSQTLHVMLVRYWCNRDVVPTVRQDCKVPALDLIAQGKAQARHALSLLLAKCQSHVVKSDYITNRESGRVNEGKPEVSGELHSDRPLTSLNVGRAAIAAPYATAPSG